MLIHCPPQKDGANSMWRKGGEFEHLKALRIAAAQAMVGHELATGLITLSVKIRAEQSRGDLDNFITGICDGLMAAHPLTPIDLTAWRTVPEFARPEHPICFTDDALISQIHAERVTSVNKIPGYHVELEW